MAVKSVLVTVLLEMYTCNGLGGEALQQVVMSECWHAGLSHDSHGT